MRARIDLRQVEACNAQCGYGGAPLELLSPGAVRHLIWPTQRNESMFTFLRERLLPN